MRLTALAWLVLPLALGAQAPSYAHARQQFDLHNYDAARPELVALTRAAPADVAPVILLGRIALNEGDLDDAIRRFEGCVRIDDASPDCHFWLGYALGNAAQHASRFRQGLLARRVKAEFERAVQIDPVRVEARIGLVQFYMLAPDRLIASIPSDRNALLVVARLAGTSDTQLPRGEQAARQWLASPPRDAGDAAKAVAHLRLGTILDKQGRRDAARAEYELASRLDPRNEEVRRAARD